MNAHVDAKGIQALRQERDDLGKEIRNLMPSREDVEGWAKVKDEVNAKTQRASDLDDQIRAWKSLIDLDDANNVEVHARAAADRSGRSIDEEHFKMSAARRVLAQCLIHGAEKAAQLPNANLDEIMSISVSNTDKATFFANPNWRPGRQQGVKNIAELGGTAGYFIQTTVMPQLIAKLKAFGGMRDAAKVIATEGGNPLSWATYDPTALSATILTENTTDGAIDQAFGSVTLNAYMFASGTLPVSLQVLQDAAVDIEAAILDMLTTSLARGQNTYFTNGTGSGGTPAQPKGVVAAAGTGYTAPTGNTATISDAFIVQLYHSIDPAYRKLPSCRFMMNDSTLKAIKLLTDTVGRPLWLPATSSSIEPGKMQPDEIYGTPYVINQDMPSLGAGNMPMLFGAFEYYMIRDVMAAMILRFTDSAYARKMQVGFGAYMRSDGQLISQTNDVIKGFVNSAT